MREDNKENYEGFEYPAAQLSAFLLSIDEFIVSLKNGEIVRFSPASIEGFKQWLLINNVRDISQSVGLKTR